MKILETAIRNLDNIKLTITDKRNPEKKETKKRVFKHHRRKVCYTIFIYKKDLMNTTENIYCGFLCHKI